MVLDIGIPFLISSLAIPSLLDTTLFPTTLDTTSKACNKGIPLESKVDNVLVNLEVIIFIFIFLNPGIFIFKLSKNMLPPSVFPKEIRPSMIIKTTPINTYQ